MLELGFEKFKQEATTSFNTIQDKYETNKTIFEDKYYSLSIKIFILSFF
jgi:hypothetical protein